MADFSFPVASSIDVRWRCVLIGAEALLIECGRSLERQGHMIVAVVSHDPAVARWAEDRGLAVLPTPAALLETALGGFDFLFSVANLIVLPAAVLALPTIAAINFHDGPLPDYAGLNTPSWALLADASGHGVTWHLMTGDIDGGAVLVERRFALAPGETALSLNRRCFAAGVETFDDLIGDLAARILRPAKKAAAPLRRFRASDRPEAACAIRWDQRAERADRLVRALAFGDRPNPLGTAQVRIGGEALVVQALEIVESASWETPGTIVACDDRAITVATASNDVALTRLAAQDGRPLALSDAIDRFGLRPGRAFDVLDAGTAAALTAITGVIARHERFWRDRLLGCRPVDLPMIDRIISSTANGVLDMAVPPRDEPARSDTVLAAIIAWLVRLGGSARFDLGFSTPVMVAQFERLGDWFAPQVPLRVDADVAADFDTLRDAVVAETRELHRRIGFAADLPGRIGAEPGLPVAVLVVDCLDDARARPAADLTIAVRGDGRACRWIAGSGLDRGTVEAMQAQLLTLLAATDADPHTTLADLPLLDATALDSILVQRNDTAGPWRDAACIHHLIAEQAARTPDAPAVTCGDRTLTYRQLDAQANRWAARLHALGVGPDVLVALCVERSIDMVVGVLAIHKAGGAYVPLDPAYPTERLAHMLADSGAPVLVTQSRLLDQLPAHSATVVCLDIAWPSLDKASPAAFDGGATPDDLAYVIYTSGSTGKPKGVMVEHRNVVNFFAGMDDRIAPSGVWLAATSLSFDISVLELCWTLARGFHVVVYTGEDRRTATLPPSSTRPLDFGLFYFASDAGTSSQDRYRLLLEGARYADREGFSAVWTPERHFHAFGGLYPNPAVTSAAVAAVTTRIQIRAGSVVLPLHHPIRVAEDWSMVDNLSNGRVGISFAAGWQPDDFVLAPDKFHDNKTVMLRDIDVVRRLWRGEAVEFPGPLGEARAVSILPRPVQPELPVWLTSAGNVETFEAAGRVGAFVLTHLLGQTVDELGVKLAAYRKAWTDAGHAGRPRAALMLHSFVGLDADAVRATVRQPLIDYLRSSAGLIKQYAWSFPAFKRRSGMDAAAGGVELDSLDASEMDALLDHAFDRYYATSGLFGTPADCRAMVERLKAIEVDEIACLIDFGIDTETVLAHLPHLDAVRREAIPLGGQDVPSLIARHGVTHFQCTPSMARMLAADAAARPALASLRHLMIGGEAFPPALAQDLARRVGGTVTNMYGPTETTIWSTVATVGDGGGPVPLGPPLRNQQVFVLDEALRPVPDGVPGELVIGGNGVTRGYHGRPELTAERFVANPFSAGERVYRTGDLVRFRAGFGLEFLGRLDNQIKLRGHRIELGEIEAALAAHPAVREAVVLTREDVPGDVRLVAYVVPAQGQLPDLRQHLRRQLPDFMVPAQVVALAAMPRTPNGKTDRNALPAETPLAPPVPAAAPVPPANDIEARISTVWREILCLPTVGATDNFFDLGGHSLLAIQAHRQLRDLFGDRLSITDIFRYPTIRGLAASLGSDSADTRATELGQSRGLDRRAALGRRRGSVTFVATSEVA